MTPTLVDPRTSVERNATLELHDGTRLAGLAWPVSEARGTVQIVHGLGEHVGRYHHVARALNEAGWNAVAYDQRGHGKSAGSRGAAPADALPNDLAQAIEQVREGMPGPPLVVLGHSMGGAIASDVVVRGLARVDGLILSSPAFAVAMTPYQRGMLAVGERLFPSLAAPNGLDPLKISRDPNVVSRYVNDPLVHSKISPAVARAMLAAGERAIAAAPHWPVPTLLLYAGDDGLVDPSGSDRFAAAANALVTASRFDELYHEILNEPERERVLESAIEWLSKLQLA